MGPKRTPGQVWKQIVDEAKDDQEIEQLASMTDAELDAEEWKQHFDAESFDLTDTGVHFFGQDYPHVMAALDGQGPVIGYDVLLRDGYLRTDSPVKRAWSGITPAPKGKQWCPEETWSTWWK